MAMFRERGKAKYGVCDFVFADETKFEEFKAETTIKYQPGSSALITSPLTHYVYNDNKEWVVISSGSGGGSGGDDNTATEADITELLADKFNYIQ